MRAVAIVLAAAASVAAAAVPTFSQQWSAAITQHTAVNQGGQNTGNGNICCPYTSQQCKVQTGYAATKQYFDLPGNRTAAVYSDGTAVVTLFNDEKEYEVDSNGDCQSFCPIKGGMFPFGVPSNANDTGAATYNGVKAEKWVTSSTAFKIVMQTMDYYVNGDKDATPVAFVQNLTPFGQPLGGETTLFQDWTNGAPDASHFVVNNKAKCPESQQCGGSSTSGSKPTTSSPSGGGSGGGSTPSSKPVESPKERFLAATSKPFGYSEPSVLRAHVARRLKAQ